MEQDPSRCFLNISGLRDLIRKISRITGEAELRQRLDGVQGNNHAALGAILQELMLGGIQARYDASVNARIAATDAAVAVRICCMIGMGLADRC